mmetsp:Transcript_22599/g.55963  ORF Transcript_22599/g.55963 Transcript_22599/m.55963 type:complete len:183 (-) Transcript_22599:126-674(-)
MDAVEPAVLKFEAFPDRTLTVMLFKEVTNAAEIQAKLRSRTLEPELALLNPAPVASLFHLQLAAHKVMASHARGTLTTHGVHSEVVYNLSASKHITEGLRRFGMAENASAVLVCRFDATAADVNAIRAAVHGRLVDAATELDGLRDDAMLKKYYRPGDLECKEGVGSVDDAIASRIGARDVM